VRASGAVLPHSARILAYRASLPKPLPTGANVKCKTPGKRERELQFGRRRGRRRIPISMKINPKFHGEEGVKRV
jgi:hypothetical protein